MQKIFRKNAVMIVTIAILILFAGNSVVTLFSVKRQQYHTFSSKIDQIIQTMKNNDKEIEAINANLDADYVTRAKATAYILEHNEEVFQRVAELQRLARLLDVDEIHVTDEDGVIIYSSVGQYVGVDFRKGKQTSEFLSILEDYKESNYFVQDEQPNTAEGKVMKYVAVARRGKKGIVQVGLDPERQKKETERNTYKYIFSLFPTDEGEELFSIDCDTDTLTALSRGMPDDSIAKRYTLERFQDCTQGALRQKKDGTYWYVVTKEYNNTLIGASIPVRVLFFKLLFNLLATLLCLVCVEIIMLVLLNYLVNQKVIIGIHQILNGLNRITDGNYDMTIEVGGNPEFEQLSSGINTMVKSVRHSSDRLAKILEMSEVPLVAFEYQEEWGHVYVTKGLKEILNLTDMDIDSFYQDKQLFINRLQEIMSHPIKGDKDIYRVTKDQYVKIHFMTEENGYLGVITDVSAEVKERQRMNYENNHDQLTGLCRYQYFKQQAAEIMQMMKTGEMCAIVMMDLDSFKQINDNYSHDVGDKYLQSFGMLLQSQSEDHCLTARRSGDEFCMMIYGYRTKEEIEEQLRQFWELLEKTPVQLALKEWKAIRASGGYVVCTTRSEMDITALLHLADQALYRAKERQKGTFIEYAEIED